MSSRSMVLGTLAATGLGASTALAETERGILSEVRIGALIHDVSFGGGKEGGIDLNGELLFTSPVPDRLTEGISPTTRWLLQPRPHFGFALNSQGDTSKLYLGLTWTAILARDLLRAEDGLRLEFFGGGSLNNGEHHTQRRDRRSLGSNLLFHIGAEIGYQITPVYSVSLYFDHDSNAGLARSNHGLNSFGLRLGIRL